MRQRNGTKQTSELLVQLLNDSDEKKNENVSQFKYEKSSTSVPLFVDVLNLERINSFSKYIAIKNAARE